MQSGLFWNNISVVAKLIVVLLWAAVIFIVAIGSLPTNPLSFNEKNKLFLLTILPESWGFFTKSPRDEDLFAYTRIDNKWQNVLLTPNSRLINVVGLKRDARAQGAECGMLLNLVSKDSLMWSKFKSISHIDCLDSSLRIKSISVANPSNSPTLCGEVWFIQQVPIPWAWSRHRLEINMPLRVIRLDIHCK